MSNTDIPSLLNTVVQKQVLKLSDELDQIPAAQKVKVVTALVKVMPQYLNVKNEQSQNIKYNVPAGNSDGPTSSNVIQLPVSS